MAKPIVHTSMRGIAINMEEMRTANSNSPAVSGIGAKVRMNAGGDTLAKNGRIDRKREQIEQEYNTRLNGQAKKVQDVRSVMPDSFESPQEAIARAERDRLVRKMPPVSNTVVADETIEAPKNVVTKDRARKLIEKED